MVFIGKLDTAVMQELGYTEKKIMELVEIRGELNQQGRTKGSLWPPEMIIDHRSKLVTTTMHHMTDRAPTPMKYYSKQFRHLKRN